MLRWKSSTEQGRLQVSPSKCVSSIPLLRGCVVERVSIDSTDRDSPHNKACATTAVTMATLAAASSSTQTAVRCLYNTREDLCTILLGSAMKGLRTRKRHVFLVAFVERD